MDKNQGIGWAEYEACTREQRSGVTLSMNVWESRNMQHEDSEADNRS